MIRYGLYAVLTDAGNEMLRRMWPVYARVLEETFVAAISPGEAEATAAALARANEAAKAVTAVGPPFSRG